MTDISCAGNLNTQIYLSDNECFMLFNSNTFIRKHKKHCFFNKQCHNKHVSL